MNLKLKLHEMPPYRPPSEADSLLIRATRSCPWNKCEFCMMYRGEKFEIKKVSQIKEDIRIAKDFTSKLKELSWEYGLGGDLSIIARQSNIPWLSEGCVKTAFIGDSNSLVMKVDDLREVINFLYETFPTLKRVTSYARAKTALRRTPEELKRLKEAGLSRLHLGLESGDDKVLKYVNKGPTASEMIEAGKKVVSSGISLSEYIMLGLGGKERWMQNALGTAKVLNEINPDYIRVRTLMLIPGTPLYDKAKAGEFEPAQTVEILKEERKLIENLKVSSFFVSDHIMNYLRVDGKLPEDKEKMLKFIDDVLSTSPEEREIYLQPEELRHL